MVAPCTRGSFHAAVHRLALRRGCPVYARKFPRPGSSPVEPPRLPRVRAEVSHFGRVVCVSCGVAPCTRGSFLTIGIDIRPLHGCPVYARKFPHCVPPVIDSVRLPRVRAEVSRRVLTQRRESKVAPCTRGSFYPVTYKDRENVGCPVYARKFPCSESTHRGARRLPRVRAEVSLLGIHTQRGEAVAPCTRGSFVGGHGRDGRRLGCPVYGRKFPTSTATGSRIGRLPRVRAEVSDYTYPQSAIIGVAPCTRGSFRRRTDTAGRGRGCPVYARKFLPVLRPVVTMPRLLRVRAEILCGFIHFPLCALRALCGESPVTPAQTQPPGASPF